MKVSIVQAFDNFVAISLLKLPRNDFKIIFSSSLKLGTKYNLQRLP